MLNKKSVCNFVCATLLVSTVVIAPAIIGASHAYAQEDVAQEQKASERKTKRTPALRARVYDQLARAQSLGDEGKTAEAVAVLDAVQTKSASMNSYELAMMYNFYGFVYYNVENFDKAIASFEQVVEQQPIPETFEQSTLFSLAQLHMMRGNYDKTIEFLERWEGLQNGQLPAKNLVLKAQAMYQKKDFLAASKYINEAVLQVENSQLGFQVDENWYVLQRAIYFELKQPRKVVEVLVKMVRLFNEPKYWLQLAGMYGELGEEQKQLALMEVAHQQGYVNTGPQMFNLAQLYYYHQMPFKAAALMAQGLEQGKLDNNLQNLKFLSQSLTLAKENNKAIPVMLAAAELSDDGELDAQLGQIYLTMERWKDAIVASAKALQKGGLRNEGTAYLVMGMAYFNEGNYQQSIEQLNKAQKYDNSRGMAQQWAKYVETERSNYVRVQSMTSLSDS
ncbi:MAG: tetratricopeptide (TPR) repeat protein [Paraglaciecola sp.]|jgi:tetratricopeptide (TPR) repeat protein